MDRINLSFSVEEISRFMELAGRRGKKVLEEISSLAPFINAVYNSEVGKEILKDDVNRYAELLDKVKNINATVEEQAEYKYLRGRLVRVSGRLNEYISNISKVKESVTV